MKKAQMLSLVIFLLSITLPAVLGDTRYTRTIYSTSDDTERDTFWYSAAALPNPGMTYASESTLYSDKNHTQFIGHAEATYIRGVHSYSQGNLEVTYIFSDNSGTITSESYYVEDDDQTVPSVWVFPVTGGTGQYAGARGVVRFIHTHGPPSSPSAGIGVSHYFQVDFDFVVVDALIPANFPPL